MCAPGTSDPLGSCSSLSRSSTPSTTRGPGRREVRVGVDGDDATEAFRPGLSQERRGLRHRTLEVVTARHEDGDVDVLGAELRPR